MNYLSLVFLDFWNNFFNLATNTPFFFYFFIFYFFSVFISLIFYPYLTLYGIFFTNFIPLFLFWLTLIFYFKKVVIDGHFYNIFLGSWIFLSSNFKVNFSFYFDSISYSFMFLTISIAVFVIPYAFSYFRYEPLVERLVLLLNLFVISMSLLVTSGNLVVLFLGWELIGLTSFFLINFWVARVATLKSAFKAFSFNKFSDFSLLVYILILSGFFFDVDIKNILNNSNLVLNFYINIFFWNVSLSDFLSLFLLSAAFVKSAQFGFHIWLPDSMEAPVPASALIHSATLVSAGVFLVLRFNVFLSFSSWTFWFLPLIGSLTACVGGFASAYQSDTKRLLAYSTISHCGFLMIVSSFFTPIYSILYLYSHGFFKASVFLCVGNVIRFNRNVQDFREMGSFFLYLPFECFFTFICLFNLGGLPLSFGFYSKHFVILSFDYLNIFSMIIIFFLIMSVFVGLFYSFRLFSNVFFDYKKSQKFLYLLVTSKFLNSTYYTNSSISSIFSIFGLVFFSYIWLFYYIFYIVLNNVFHFEVSLNLVSTSNFLFFFVDLFSLNFLFLLNICILFFILLVALTQWSFKYLKFWVNYKTIFFFFFIVILFNIF